ncbi:MAG: hypothetical protein KJZ54_11345 [Phycisphaerales bacterium]|nr:hypothetical protein [Phycisphaerales bacterium]
MPNSIIVQGRISPQLLDAAGLAADVDPLAGFADQASAGLGLVVAAVVGLVGLALWLFGAKLMKPAAAFVGAVLGATAGFAVLAGTAGAGAENQPPLAAGVGIGALLGLGAALLLYRMVVATTAAATLGAIGVLAAAAAWGPALGSNMARPTAAVAHASEAQSSPAQAKFVMLPSGTIVRAKPTEQKSQTAATGLGMSAIGVDGGLEGLRSAFLGMDPAKRSGVLLAGIAGGLTGLFIGLVWPRRTSALVSAIAGSALWLAAVVWIARTHDLPGAGLAERTPAGWLITWALVAIIGFAIQGLMSARTVASPSAQPA